MTFASLTTSKSPERKNAGSSRNVWCVHRPAVRSKTIKRDASRSGAGDWAICAWGSSKSKSSNVNVIGRMPLIQLLQLGTPVVVLEDPPVVPALVRQRLGAPLTHARAVAKA